VNQAGAASPTPALLGGLVVTLIAVLVYSIYTVHQIRTVRDVQEQLVDRNRRASLQLLRIQDNLNELGLAMRDIIERSEPYPVTAWEAPLGRIRRDLDDALGLEAALAVGRARDDDVYLRNSLRQFWDAFDRVFEKARKGREAEACGEIRDSLQARREALAALIARQLVNNTEASQRAGAQMAGIYDRLQRNTYLFLAAMLALVIITGVVAIHFNRRLFERITELSRQRSTLSRQLISTQEETLRYVSRELHDEFGQILTAIGVMARRAERHAAGTKTAQDLSELQTVAQEALDKVRSLSQSLQPVILQESGLLAAVEWYLPVVERQTALTIRYQPPETGLALPYESSIHVFRVLQEALNNVVRHSGAGAAQVRIHGDASRVVLEVEDSGKGIGSGRRSEGMGLVAMRERALLLGGRLHIGPGAAGGTLIQLEVPISGEAAAA
jgi:signal transduction histidine kinase